MIQFSPLNPLSAAVPQTLEDVTQLNSVKVAGSTSLTNAHAMQSAN